MTENPSQRLPRWQLGSGKDSNEVSVSPLIIVCSIGFYIGSCNNNCNHYQL
ncbi:hypothetical protein Hanom_Chr15g01348581 [Helianthus anomalus]